MKSCLQCGKQAEDVQKTCDECGREFSFTPELRLEVSHRSIYPEQEPNGMNLAKKGVLIFWFSLVGTFIGYIFIQPELGMGIFGWPLIIIAAIMYPISGLFWATGKIIHAISYYAHKIKN